MKKIGLCICYSVKNYGSMLQAFATTKYIEKAHFDYEILRYEKKHGIAFFIKSLSKLGNAHFRKEVFRLLSYKNALRKNRAFAKNIALRNAHFEAFMKTHFSHLSAVAHTYRELKQLGKRFPAYLVGSDQLWLPSGLSTNFYNLHFTAESAVRISYATSFGVSAIPCYQSARTKAFLQRIQFLSVREQKGQEIVTKLTQRTAELVVDPTLLLTADDWLIYIPHKAYNGEAYIFVYFIGNNPEHRATVQKLKQLTGLKVIALIHIDEYISSDEDLYDETPFDIGPDGFVNLIRNATYVCTDSFHGTVFSILHKKQFIVFDRFSAGAKASTNSRIDSLCTVLGLETRRFNSAADFCALMKAPVNYDETEKKLNALRASSMRFLDAALASVQGES